MLKRVYELMACLVTFDDEIISPCAFYFRRPGSPFSIALDQINFDASACCLILQAFISGSANARTLIKFDVTHTIMFEFDRAINWCRDLTF